MTDKDFDSVLNKIASDETLPFDEKNWNMLQNRLDGKKPSRRLIALLPFGIKQYAAAACMAVAGAGMLTHYSNNDQAPAPVITKAQSDIPANNKANNNEVNPVITAAINQNTNTKTASKLIASARVSTKPAPAAIEPKTENKTIAAPAIETQQKDNNIAAITDVQLPVKKEKQLPYTFNYEPTRASNTSLALNGGIGLYSGNNLSAGITIRNRLSNRVSLEASIAYAQGNQNVYTKNTQVSDPVITKSETGSPVDAVGVVTTSYAQRTRNISYLQVSPGVNIKLLSKLNTSVGADIQKTLINDGTLSSINDSKPPEAKKIPGIDPGVMLNLNYAVTKRIGGGVAYRQSVLSLANEGKQYTQRSYFMFQLQYLLIK